MNKCYHILANHQIVIYLTKKMGPLLEIVQIKSLDLV